MPQSSPPFRRLPASIVAGLALAGNLFAQSSVRLAQDVPLLKDPGGIALATLVAGTRVTPGKVAGGFAEVTLRGWIFTASTRVDQREGFDVSAALNENVRAEPDGLVLARAVPGALFSRVSRRGGWTQVRRTGWVQRARLAPPPARPPAPAPPAATQVVTPPAVTKPAPSPPESSAPAPAAPVRAERVHLRDGATLSRAPDGITVGKLTAPADATVEERTGDWVRVRVDAWVKRTDVDGPLSPPPAITAAMIRENPERYVGQTVEWRVQFLAQQRADELRPEMPSGRPYLLTRGPLPESGFVYVLVTREQAEQLQGLQPLDELSLTATVRAARTRYLATPVVELVRLLSGAPK